MLNIRTQTATYYKTFFSVSDEYCQREKKMMSEYGLLGTVQQPFDPCRRSIMAGVRVSFRSFPSLLLLPASSDNPKRAEIELLTNDKLSIEKTLRSTTNPMSKIADL